MDQKRTIEEKKMKDKKISTKINQNTSNLKSRAN